MKYTAAILSFASTALAQGCAQYSTWSGNGYQLNNNLWGQSSVRIHHISPSLIAGSNLT
jgi:hypothetical protein